MDVIGKITVDNWIAIAAIVIPLFLAGFVKIRVLIWSLFSRFFLSRKIEVVTPALDQRFATLNAPIKVCPYLDKNGKISMESLLLNHKALFSGTVANPGQLRINDVFIKCYKIRDEEGGTALVGYNENNGTTNLMPAIEVELTLREIINNWNAKVEKVKGYGEIDKIEFISRFHVYFEMVHPFVDGNGRVGRALLSEQISFLFDQLIKFQPNMKMYYASMEAAIRGDESELRLLIQSQVEGRTVTTSAS